jgi:hypothetical protein
MKLKPWTIAFIPVGIFFLTLIAYDWGSYFMTSTATRAKTAPVRSEEQRRKDYDEARATLDRLELEHRHNMDAALEWNLKNYPPKKSTPDLRMQ